MSYVSKDTPQHSGFGRQGMVVLLCDLIPVFLALLAVTALLILVAIGQSSDIDTAGGLAVMGP